MTLSSTRPEDAAKNIGGAWTWLVLAALACGARGAAAQIPGSLADERDRLAEITGDSAWRRPGARTLAPARIAAGVPMLSRLSVGFVRADVRATWNSRIPYSVNDGPMWAGRGWNLALTGGVAAEHPLGNARVRVILAPTAVYAANLPFHVLQGTAPGRSAFSNPFHGRAPGASMDLPLRFGDRPITRLDPGRSSVELRTDRVALGATTENEWWGPGIRNTLVLSSNAPGIPRLYVSTGRPVRSRAGSLEAKLVAGTLTESFVFDLNPGNDYRALSGVLLRLRPAFDTALTLGVARVSYTTVLLSFAGTLEHALDAITRWERIRSASDTLSDGRSSQRADQITSVFARWFVPAAGFEVYGEWARMDTPRTATELLTAPHHTGGYTLGLQWAQGSSRAGVLRLQCEITYLEQSRVLPDRPTPDFYAGTATLQGYTQRGQPIGAAIGPGASSQWIAVDRLTRSWQAGAFAGRIRWDNDALYRQVAPNSFRHDVTLLAGIRGGMRRRYADLSAEATFGYRFNFQFQNGGANPGGFRTVDARNLTVTLRAAPPGS
jgi:hypothetical protein